MSKLELHQLEIRVKKISHNGKWYCCLIDRHGTVVWNCEKDTAEEAFNAGIDRLRILSIADFLAEHCEAQ